MLGRFVDIGAQLFAMSATLSRAQAMVERMDPEASNALDLAEYFCRCSRFRIAEWFRSLARNADDPGYRLSGKILASLPEILSEANRAERFPRNANRSEFAARAARSKERFSYPGLSGSRQAKRDGPATPPPSPGCHPAQASSTAIF